jgi:hypothetical protein
LRATDTFRDAEALAEFANLDPADANAFTYFRNNYPNFAPAEWWDYLYRRDGARVLRYEDVIHIAATDPNFKEKIENKIVQQWQHAQEQIQWAWKAKFKFTIVSALPDLLKLVFYVDRPGLVWNSSQVLLPNGTIYDLNSPVCSFHKAVLYLHEHPNQAKICEECGKFFVTAAGKRSMCLYPNARGETCSQRRINQQHLQWWNEVGNKRRKAKQELKRKK